MRRVVHPQTLQVKELAKPEIHLLIVLSLECKSDINEVHVKYRTYFTVWGQHGSVKKDTLSYKFPTQSNVFSFWYHYLVNKHSTPHHSSRQCIIPDSLACSSGYWHWMTETYLMLQLIISELQFCIDPRTRMREFNFNMKCKFISLVEGTVLTMIAPILHITLCLAHTHLVIHARADTIWNFTYSNKK